MCSMKVTRILLIAFNMAFFIFGITLIVLGSLMLKYTNVSTEDSSSSSSSADPDTGLLHTLSSAPALEIFIGVCILVISFLGAMGAYRKSVCILTAFVVCMAIVIIFSIAGGILTVVYKDKTADLFGKVLTKLSTTKSSSTSPFHGFEYLFSCCGLNGKNDYTGTIPDACCAVPMDQSKCPGNNYFTVGCLEASKTKMPYLYMVLAAISFIVGIISLIGAVMAGRLITFIRTYEPANR